jgi:hypothetical protein
MILNYGIFDNLIINNFKNLCVYLLIILIYNVNIHNVRLSIPLMHSIQRYLKEKFNLLIK